MSTVIVGIVIFGAAGFVIYRKVTHKGGGCHSTSCHCAVNPPKEETSK